MQPDIAKTIFEKVKALPVTDQREVLEMVAKKASVSRQNNARPIWEVIAEISSEIPDEEWETLPSDGSVNHDHYLYGARKKY